MKTSGHLVETKAAAMSALLLGQSVSSVARDYKLPKGTVSNWKRQAQRDIAKVQTESTQTAREREAIGVLLLEYVKASLVALAAQARVFADPVWLAKQDASELAVLHGVQTDKAVRMLESLGATSDADAS